MKTIASPMGAPGGLPGLLRARLGWVLLTTLAVMAGTAAYSWSRTPMYRAEAGVAVDPRAVQGTTPLIPNMETEKAIASSGVVLGMAASSLGIRGSELSDGLSITVPADSRVLRISYSHRDPHEARRRAQALADAYVAFHLTGMVRGVVITGATLPRSPASPNHVVDIGIALLVGLCVGVGGAMVRDRLDDRLRGPDDFEAQIGRRVWATIPAFRSAGTELASQFVMIRNPDSLVAEAYRNLRTLLLQTATRHGVKTLLVTSPSGQGTTTVAANLAAAIAQSGRRVVLVGADLRRPRTHQVFGVENQVGLTAVINGHLDVSKALFATNVGDLLLLPAGSPSDPGTVLLAPALQKALDELRGTADFVVIDAPPVLAGPDIDILAELVEMILLVADARRSTGAQVRSVARQAQVREKVIGCVLDNVGRRRRLSKSIHRERTPDTALRPQPRTTTADSSARVTSAAAARTPPRSSNNIDIPSGN
jgi:polysaccharide biosynthesis transport protein